jgi:acyl-CoA thioesterase-2
MSPRESLREMLVVSRAGGGRYRCALESFWGEPILGDLLARCVLAAAMEGVSAPLRSLHATFDARPDAEAPLELELTSRGSVVRFDVEKDATSVCAAVARFEASRKGLAYQPSSAPPAPDPDGLPSTLQAARAEGWPEDYARGPFEFRRVGHRIGAVGGDAPHVTWICPRVPLGGDAAWHTAALVFASQFYAHWAFEWRLGTGIDYAGITPLDHAIWLHGEPRFDDWVLLVARSERAANGIALGRRELYARDGTLVLTAAHTARVAMAQPSR